VADSDAYALQRSDLNRFLFADVGVEASGMTLSVLSALARRGVDPWQEAGRLAKLPQPAAVDGLAKIITAMPASLWSAADATIIARRLVALLPSRGTLSSASLPKVSVSNPTQIGERLMAHRWTLVAALGAALILGLVYNMVANGGANAPAPSGFSAVKPAEPVVPTGH
jgi:hypothetical protein